MTRANTPQYTALRDQADAAARQGAGILAHIAAEIGGPLTEGQPTGQAAVVEARFLRRLSQKQLTPCPHVTGGPEPLWWLAWRPGRLRCAACTERASLAIHGTPEERRCDACHRIRPTIYPSASQFPALLIDLPGLPLRAFGPVTCLWGLCPPCRETSLNPTRTGENRNVQ